MSPNLNTQGGCKKKKKILIGLILFQILTLLYSSNTDILSMFGRLAAAPGPVTVLTRPAASLLVNLANTGIKGVMKDYMGSSS